MFPIFNAIKKQQFIKLTLTKIIFGDKENEKVKYYKSAKKIK